MTLLKLSQEQVNLLPSLNDLQVFLRSFDLVPESMHRAEMLTLQATGRCFTSSFFRKQPRFLWSITESNSTTSVLDGHQEPERSSDCGKVFFFFF